MSKRVIVAGGRGFLGRAIIGQLKRKGHSVTVISRRSGEDLLTWNEIKAGGLPEADAIVNLSGSQILDFSRPWTSKFQEECVESRTETTNLLARIASDANKKPEVFIATSAVGYYPTNTGKKFTEEYVSRPQDSWAIDLCHKIEQAAEPAVSCQDIRTVLMRLGVVLGRGGGAYDNMRLPFLFGLGGAFGSGKQMFPWVHIEDAASMYTWAIENPDVEGPLNNVAPGCVSNSAFVSALGSAMGRPSALNVPATLLELAGSERASMLLEGQNVLPAKALDCGFKFKYPTVGGCCEELVTGKD